MNESTPRDEAEREAIQKAEKFKSKDPFPGIPCALLNSADIEDYVNATGMVCPFNKGSLKSASYEAEIGDVCIYWEPGMSAPEKREIRLDGEYQFFQLKPNSIAFVEIHPTFRLPDYIAMRFNLKITQVYRGLLLGTGPLVDPGFEGKIFIPLHNLTSNTYKFPHRSGLIWVEFTKISPNERWTGEACNSNRKGEYVEFPDDKKRKSIDYYFKKANGGDPIVSSIPDAINEAKHLADSADKKAKSIRNWGVGISVVGILSAIVAFGSLMYDLSSTHQAYIEKSEELLDEYRASDQDRQEDDLRDRITSLESQIDLLREEIERLEEIVASPN